MFHDADSANVGITVPPLGIAWLHDLDIIQHRKAYVDDASDSETDEDEDDSDYMDDMNETW